MTFSGAFNTTDFNGLSTTFEPVFIYFKEGLYSVGFTNGSTEFTISSRVRGTRTRAVAEVDSYTLISGSWAGGDAAGTLYLKMKRGYFIKGEELEVLP
jgi:hypothetical protein